MGAAGAVNYLTTDKVAVMGAAGAVGSNLVQALLSTGTANTVAMYDPYGPGLEGAAEEIYHCAFPDAQVTWTTDAGEALDGAAYVLSSGGAPRREGMTREDLLRGNAEIAAQLGRDLNDHAPEAKLVVIVFNPADITGLVTLVHSGLPPQRVTTLAALDSTRLQTRLAQHFSVPQHLVHGCRTYGGHGQEMALYKGAIQIDGVPLNDIVSGGAWTNGVGLERRGLAGNPPARARRRRARHQAAGTLVVPVAGAPHRDDGAGGLRRRGLRVALRRVRDGRAVHQRDDGHANHAWSGRGRLAPTRGRRGRTGGARRGLHAPAAPARRDDRHGPHPAGRRLGRGEPAPGGLTEGQPKARITSSGVRRPTLVAEYTAASTHRSASSTKAVAWKAPRRSKR